MLTEKVFTFVESVGHSLMTITAYMQLQSSVQALLFPVMRTYVVLGERVTE